MLLRARSGSQHETAEVEEASRLLSDPIFRQAWHKWLSEPPAAYAMNTQVSIALTHEQLALMSPVYSCN
jgi:hypothetical protein